MVRTFILLGCAGFVSVLSIRVCDPLVLVFAVTFGVSLGTAAWTVFGFTIAYGVMQLVYGPLADRYGKLRVLFGAVVAGAIGNAVIALGPNFEMVVVGRVLAGAAGAGIVPIALAWLGDNVPLEERHAAITRYLCSTILGMSFGQWGGASVAQIGGWRSVFWTICFLFAVIAVALWISIWFSSENLTTTCREERIPDHRQDFRSQLAKVLRAPMARYVMITAIAEGLLVLGAFSMVPSFLQHGFGLSISASGALAALYGVGGLLFAILGRRLSMLVGQTSLVMAGALCLSLSMSCLAMGKTLLLCSLACFLAGFGFYMLHSTVQLHATQMLPESRGTAVSVFVFALFVGQSLGTVLASFLLDAGYATVFFGIGFIVLPVLGGWFRYGITQYIR